MALACGSIRRLICSEWRQFYRKQERDRPCSKFDPRGIPGGARLRVLVLPGGLSEKAPRPTAPRENASTIRPLHLGPREIAPASSFGVTFSSGLQPSQHQLGL